MTARAESIEKTRLKHVIKQMRAGWLNAFL
jgi:hypothetical protein